MADLQCTHIDIAPSSHSKAILRLKDRIVFTHDENVGELTTDIPDGLPEAVQALLDQFPSIGSVLVALKEGP